MSYDAVVLAGGQGARLGGPSKPEVRVGGRMLLDHVLEAVLAGPHRARRVVVVGPDTLRRPGVSATVLEHPPSGGPVAGIDAGLTALAAAGDPGGATDLPVLVLACDVPLVGGAVPRLVAALTGAPDADGAHLVDAGGHAQLVALYRRPALAAALAGLVAAGGVHGVSVRRLVGGLDMVPVRDLDDQGTDADTWDDVRRLEEIMTRRAAMSDPGSTAGSDLHRWVVGTAADLGVDPDALDVEMLLDLAREVANGVARPAVPLTSFLVGYATGAGGGDRAAFERATARAAELVRLWSAERATP